MRLIPSLYIILTAVGTFGSASPQSTPPPARRGPKPTAHDALISAVMGLENFAIYTLADFGVTNPEHATFIITALSELVDTSREELQHRDYNGFVSNDIVLKLVRKLEHVDLSDIEVVRPLVENAYENFKRWRKSGRPRNGTIMTWLKNLFGIRWKSGPLPGTTLSESVKDMITYDSRWRSGNDLVKLINLVDGIHPTSAAIADNNGLVRHIQVLLRDGLNPAEDRLKMKIASARVATSSLLSHFAHLDNLSGDILRANLRAFREELLESSEPRVDMILDGLNELLTERLISDATIDDEGSEQYLAQKLTEIRSKLAQLPHPSNQRFSDVENDFVLYLNDLVRNRSAYVIWKTLRTDWNGGRGDEGHLKRVKTALEYSTDIMELAQLLLEYGEAYPERLPDTRVGWPEDPLWRRNIPNPIEVIVLEALIEKANVHILMLETPGVLSFNLTTERIRRRLRIKSKKEAVLMVLASMEKYLPNALPEGDEMLKTTTDQLTKIRKLLDHPTEHGLNVLLDGFVKVKNDNIDPRDISTVMDTFWNPRALRDVEFGQDSYTATETVEAYLEDVIRGRDTLVVFETYEALAKGEPGAGFDWMNDHIFDRISLDAKNMLEFGTKYPEILSLASRDLRKDPVWNKLSDPAREVQDAQFAEYFRHRLEEMRERAIATMKPIETTSTSPATSTTSRTSLDTPVQSSFDKVNTRLPGTKLHLLERPASPQSPSRVSKGQTPRHYHTFTYL